MKSFKKIWIGNHEISDNKPTFIIAEIGINHEGNYKKCLELINKAKLAGANGIKLQLANPESNYKRGSKSFKIYKKSEFSLNQIRKIYKYASKKKIILFFTMDDYHFKNIKINQQIYKISSSQFNNLKLIKNILKKNKPLLISTGMSNCNEILALSKFLRQKTKVIFMHCISRYPLKNSECNLSMISFLKEKTKGIVGYSDHTKGTIACEIATMLGAKIIEKHFTYNTKRKGFDHKISLDYKNFKKMVKNIRDLENMLGSEKFNNAIKNSKKVSKQKRSYLLDRDLKKGSILKLEHVITKRIGKSESVNNLIRYLGKKIKSNTLKNTEISKKILV